MRKKYLLLVCNFVLQTSMFAEQNFLSKIIITSKKAVCRKVQAKKNTFALAYQDDVKVTFADGSIITSDFLDVTFEPSGQDAGFSEQSPRFDSLKNIIFNSNVSILHDKQRATAQKAELFLQQKICRLSGDVTILQKKERPKDIPVTIKSDTATFNLQTSEVTFVGNPQKPVNTVIVLKGHPALQKKSKK